MTSRPLFISTFCCIGYPLRDALAIISSRTSHVEILSDGLHDLLAGCNSCEEFAFTYSVHAPCAEVNIAAVTERMRSASISVLGEVLEVSARIGAEHLVVHPGFSPYEQVREKSYASLLRSLDELVQLQEEYGITICVENMGGWECCHFRTPEFLPELRERDLGFAFDVGHALLNRNLDMFFEAGGFCHVHLHDNGGETDDHLACGNGITDFSSLISRIPDQAILVVETKDLPAADRSLRFLSSLIDRRE